MSTIDDIMGRKPKATTLPPTSGAEGAQANVGQGGASPMGEKSTPAPQYTQDGTERQEVMDRVNGTLANKAGEAHRQGRVFTPPAATPQPQRPEFYNGMFALLDEEEKRLRPKSAEEEAREEKRARRDNMFAAIGDGISALSNLYFTTKGAPDSYDPRNSMSEKAQARWERMKKERDENRDRYLNVMMKKYGLEAEAAKNADAKAASERDWQYKVGRDKRADAIADAKEKRDQAMHDLDIKLAGHKISAAEADANRKKIASDYAEEFEKAKVETEKAKGASQRASASASNAKAGYYNRGGSGGDKLTLTIDGKTYRYKSKEDYERAVMRYAKEYGVDTAEDVETTDEEFSARDGRLKSKKKNITRRGRDVSKIAGEVEEKSNKKSKSTGLGLGSDSSNGKKTGLGL